MEGARKILRIFGIDIQLHFSWWIVFFLLTWSLSTAFFPQFFPNNPAYSYWLMGLAAALLLFVSVLLHELAHSLVAKAMKVKVESITLFFFGGIASINSDEMKPRAELLMALAGPLFSLSLSLLFYLTFKNTLNEIIMAIAFYLYQLNFILALFNLVPAFPLDGGRALRALLYGYYKDLKKATKIAAFGGKVFAGFLVFLGIVALFNNLGNGLWFIVLGGFLYFVAGMSYEQVIIKEVLSKIPITGLLKKKIPTISPQLKFADFVKKYADTEEDSFLVKGKGFQGIMNTKQINRMLPQVQQLIKVKQLACPINQIVGICKEDNAYTAFKRFAEGNTEILPVWEGKKLLGFVTRKSLMHRMIWELKYGQIKRKK